MPKGMPSAAFPFINACQVCISGLYADTAWVITDNLTVSQGCVADVVQAAGVP